MSTESNTPVDPRVQIELEKLNTATDNINKYEVELDEAKCEFKRLLAESVVRIKAAAHKLGNSIDAAKPYYESRIYAAQLTKETQLAAANHEKAKSIHAAAKEMVYLAEQGLGEKSTLDTACQEMLSHAASKVNQSQLEVTDTRNALKMCQLKLEVANNRVGKLQGQLKQALRASRLQLRRNLLLLRYFSILHALYCTLCSPYYETRANYNGLLKAQKLRVNELETRVSAAKLTYNEALKNLEQISEDIHRQRQQRNNLLNYEAMLRQVDAVDALTAGVTRQQQPEPAESEQEQEQLEDEYLRMPERLGSGASSPRQRQADPHDCPHLLHDFEAVLTFPQKLAGGMHKSASTSATDGDNNLFAQAQGLHGPYEVKPRSESGSSSLASASASASASVSTSAPPADNDIDQWTEIRLSHSDSTSSSYSNQSLLEQHGLDGAGSGGGHGLGYGLGSLEPDAQSQHSTSSSDEPKRKVTCTTIFQDDSSAIGIGIGQQMSRKQSLSQWLSRSNSFKTSGRRQSLDLLIDAGDKVKDVFSYGFQKVGRTLERRNSESEMASDGGEADALLASTTTTTTTTTTTSSTTTTAAAAAAAAMNVSNNSSSSAGDFFLFSRSSEPKELLSDEQVENLLLNHMVDEHGVIIVEELKSPTAATRTTTSMYHPQQQPQQQQQQHHTLSVAGAARAALLF
ncbi:SH3 domain-binding protein 5 isoform X1 [Drosophila novamexicana]|uniref:SH3 domain-binding protein 5 isoform X1 n=1 Tax=Drosophila novamexicana TaxID=47314 RepID=UPI0011E605BE|nr:SH3 domain-binding protein 5 isoform X1 [Drosophila novamexicana]